MESKKIRSSNMELLRIVAMLMIIPYHMVCHAVYAQLTDENLTAQFNNGLFNHPAFYKKLFILDAVMPFGTTANSLFILISGYFLITKGKNIDLGKTAKKLLSQLAFATVVLVIASNIYFHLNGQNPVNMICINDFNGLSWFVGYYFAIVVIAALFFNKYLMNLDKKGYITFLLVTFGIVQLSWLGTLTDGPTNGLRTLSTGIFLYALGGYIQIYNPFKKVRTPIILLLIAAVYVLVFVSSYNNTQARIQYYLINGSKDTFIQSVIGYSNYNLVPIILSISIFEIFRRIHIPNSKIINFIGGSTFMIYLIHDNNFFISVWKSQDWITLLYNSPIGFVIKIICWTIVAFIIGVFAYIIYNFAVKILKSSKRIIFNESVE